jgi:hypothetical protein
MRLVFRASGLELGVVMGSCAATLKARDSGAHLEAATTEGEGLEAVASTREVSLEVLKDAML